MRTLLQMWPEQEHLKTNMTENQNLKDIIISRILIDLIKAY